MTDQAYVYALAQEIRRVDGNHKLGAAELAEALMPFIRTRLIAELGQEVGAVSFAEWFRDACSATDFDANNGDAAAATNRSYARQAWCAAMTSSPAHTSEARDAVLKGVRELAIKAAAHWDADEDMKVGKILMALAGQLPKYDKRADAFDAALEASP